MITLEEAAEDVVKAWKLKQFMKPSIQALEGVLVYNAKEKKVKQ